MYAKGTRSGPYMPKNMDKYIGHEVPLTYRSSWELTAFRFFDNNPNVKFWSSESIQIPYMKPLPNGNMRPAIYYPDIYVEFVTKTGEYKKELLEIKPKKYTKRSRSKNVQTKLNENYALAVNQAKWEAAKRWCATRGVEFKVLTEQSLFG